MRTAAAWRKYHMIVQTGIEFNKDGYTRKSSAHLLGIGLKAPIPSVLDLPETIAQIHAQCGLAVTEAPRTFYLPPPFPAKVAYGQ